MMKVVSVHPDTNTIDTALGTLTYDYLVVANGSTSNFFGNDRIKRYLISFRNKLLVFTNWVWNYFNFDKGNRLIIRPYIKPEKPVADSKLVPAPQGATYMA